MLGHRTWLCLMRHHQLLHRLNLPWFPRLLQLLACRPAMLLSSLRFRTQLLCALVCKAACTNRRSILMGLLIMLNPLLQGSRTRFRRLRPLLIGSLQWLMNTTRFYRIRLGLFLRHMVVTSLIVSGSSSSNTRKMVLWIVTKLDWL
jgi:hypothetical protein